MSSLIHLPEELKKEFKLHPDGKVSCSIRGLGRMLCVNDTTLGRHFGAGLETSQIAKTLIAQGFAAAGLQSWSETGVPDTAIPFIAEYYAFDAKQVSDETRNAARSFIRVTSAIGVRTWMQKELGYEHGESRDTLFSQLSLMMQEAIQPILQTVEKQNKMLESSFEEKQQLQDENTELNEFKEEVEIFPEFVRMLEIAKNDIPLTEYLDGISCKEYIIKNRIPLDEEAWCTLSRRTASYYRSTKGKNPTKRGSHNIYYSTDVAYIVATLNLIMRGL
ncbi:MAG TPA: hypothetical protein VFM18_08250 [Methanosarcina sp.]|nr:hypothetical protein [Methanosarcina sp.]